MLDATQAQACLADAFPELQVEDWILYKDVYLFRTSLPNSDEGDYDPFFSVDTVSGWVEDFSIMHDGDISEIMKAFSESQNSTKTTT